MADLRARGEPEPSTSTASRSKAKQLSFGIIPKAVDEYRQFRGELCRPADRAEARQSRSTTSTAATSPAGRLADQLQPAPEPRRPAAGSSDRETIWALPRTPLQIRRLRPNTAAAPRPRWSAIAVAYARDFVAPSLRRRPPTEEEAEALRELDDVLATRLAGRTTTRRGDPEPHLRNRQGALRQGAACATGSRRSTKPCSARARARAWAASSRFTGSTTAAS